MPARSATLAAALVLLAPPAQADDLESIHYGRRLVDKTFAYIGPEVADPDMRFAGNNLACTDCHMDAGRKSHGLSLVGVSAKYPKPLADGGTQSLAERVNGCMLRSMNGRPLPEDSAELAAFVAYLDQLTTDAGSFGDPVEDPVALADPGTPPDPARGGELYASHCAGCHGPDGRGVRNGQPGDALGYLHPPLWGPDSYNAAAGMDHVAMAAAFIHDNMPLSTTSTDAPILTPQDAWDIAAYVDSQPRPPGPKD
jgi:thiosulfate dehydrogenase